MCDLISQIYAEIFYVITLSKKLTFKVKFVRIFFFSILDKTLHHHIISNFITYND